MSDPNDQDDEVLVLKVNDDAVVPHAVLPKGP